MSDANEGAAPRAAGTSEAGSGAVRPVVSFGDIDLLAARQRLDTAEARRTTTIGYVSRGHCLVIGTPDAALAAAERLRVVGAGSVDGEGIDSVTAVHVDPTVERLDKALTDTGTALFTVPVLALGGHLGAFTARSGETDLALSAQRPDARFDLVLDLSPVPLFGMRLPPLGYVHVPANESPEGAIETLSGLVGEFDKPRYFAYDASICAHSRSRLAGCSNCLDVCVTGAITSAGDGVAIDPYLCQGCGSCATLCPSGAMVYAYPKPSDAIARTRVELDTRAAATGQAVDTLLLHGESLQADVDAAAVPPGTLSLAVEEVSAFGIDYWASVLCAGVGRILVVMDAPDEVEPRELDEAGAAQSRPVADGPNPNRLALEGQAVLLQRLVADLLGAPDAAPSGAPDGAGGTTDSLPDAPSGGASLGHGSASGGRVAGGGPDHAVVRVIDRSALANLDALSPPVPSLVALADPERRPAAFSTHDDKRQTLRLALDMLAAALAPGAASASSGTIGESAAAIVPLPPGAPFGRIAVDTDACTLCMACVSTCPAGALLDGQDTPALRMVEANCVQCGLCEQACPESAIALEPRYLRDSLAARRIETLHAEAPFHCVSCHKAFATRRIIETMIGKLGSHRMFQGDKALRRLKMCEDCRVKDIFSGESGGIDVHGDGTIAGGSVESGDTPPVASARGERRSDDE